MDHIAMTDAVQRYIEELPSNERSVMWHIYGMITEFPGIRPEIKFRIPFFSGITWICYMNPLKTGGVELAFLRAKELGEASTLLNFKNRTMVGGIDIPTLKELDQGLIRVLLEDAIELDRHTKPKTPGRKKRK